MQIVRDRVVSDNLCSGRACDRLSTHRTSAEGNTISGKRRKGSICGTRIMPGLRRARPIETDVLLLSIDNFEHEQLDDNKSATERRFD